LFAGCKIEGSFVDSQWGFEFPHFSKITFKWVINIVSPEAKRPELEAKHSPPSSTEVKNKRSYSSAVPIRLLGMYE
jgi:hypothetical protein